MTILVAGLVASVVVPAAPAGGSPDFPSHRIPGRFIVDLVDESDADAVARDHRGRVGFRYQAVLGGFLFAGPDDAADDLERDDRVESVHPDLPVQATDHDTIPTGIRRIVARHPVRDDAHDLDRTGHGQRIAILDTGIAVNHPDLRVNHGLGKDCTGGGTTDDHNGHGTHVAGTAAGFVNHKNVVGVAPAAILVPVRVLNSSGSGSTSTIMCGVNHLTALATDGDPSNDVLTGNMSLSGSGGSGNCSDGGLRQAVCESVAAGVLYTAAAGNSGGPAGKVFPGNYPEVVTVSGFTDFDGWPGGAMGCRDLFGRTECDDAMWTRSNHGWVIDLTAPGVLILSDAAGGGTETRSGTSMSAPHVAGAAALVRQLRPGWNPDRIRDHLRTTGECPDKTMNGSAWWCDGKWKNDPDGWTEPLVNARWAVETLLP